MQKHRKVAYVGAESSLKHLCCAKKKAKKATTKNQNGYCPTLHYLRRTTLDNERKWSISELERAAIVWAMKGTPQIFHGIPLEVETDYLPLQNLANLSDKSNRVQRWVEFLNAYTFTIKHRSKNANANADVLSRLPLPATAEDLQPRYRLTDPSDLNVTS